MPENDVNEQMIVQTAARVAAGEDQIKDLQTSLRVANELIASSKEAIAQTKTLLSSRD